MIPDFAFFHKIEEYKRNNPRKWKEDGFNIGIKQQHKQDLEALIESSKTNKRAASNRAF